MNPWSREPWPWILMSGPAAVIVAGAVTTWIAVATSDGLVADDYYKRGLAGSGVLRREQAAAKRAIAARIGRDAARMRVRRSGDAPAALAASLVHRTQAGRDLRL